MYSVVFETCIRVNIEKMLCEQKNSYHDKTSEEITIKLLCDNILLEILSYLNARELMEASLVCKQWNELIGLSAVTMNKFKFFVTNEMVQFRLQNFGSSRNHQNYFIRVEDSTDWTVFVNNIELSRVKSFHIKRSRFYELIGKDVLKVLSMLLALENLILSGVRLDVIEESERLQLIKMRKLKSVIISGYDFAILKCIDAKELQDLQCTCSRSVSVDDHQSIANSLVRFSNLKRLTIKGCMEMFEHLDINKTKLKLNFFDVYHINVNPENVNDFSLNLRTFLLLQADSLRELRFDFSMFDTSDGQNVVNDFLQIAFNKCKNLSFLDIRNLSLSRDGNSYQSLSPNRSIKSLKVHWNFEGEVLEALLRNSPQLENLRAEYCYLDDDGINHIAALCRRLTHLHTFKLIGIVKEDMLFENLKYLDIVKIENGFEPLIALVTKSLIIEQIRIHECKLEGFPMDLIMQQPSMKKLIIEGKCYEIVTDENKFRIVKKSHLEQL